MRSQAADIKRELLDGEYDPLPFIGSVTGPFWKIARDRFPKHRVVHRYENYDMCVVAVWWLAPFLKFGYWVKGNRYLRPIWYAYWAGFLDTPPGWRISWRDFTFHFRRTLKNRHKPYQHYKK
jgi:hypothetical protein